MLKFVPASGAASRMFKELFSFLSDGKVSTKVQSFLTEIEEYPFYHKLLSGISVDEDDVLTEDQRKQLISYMLNKDGLNYGGLPKGMILFHKYPDGHTRTAFEEHFHEGVLYASKSGKVRIHFTVPDDAREIVETHLESLKGCLSEMFKVDFIIETSIQKPSTDTPAIDKESNQWVLLENGSPLFRPAGHGALLENLNDLDADLVFVKNIDNVVPDRLKQITVENKELLAGILLEVQDRLFQFCEDYQNGVFNRDDCVDFIQKWFYGDYSNYSNEDLFRLMNRPLRVCGMVKNEGEPGGGPFLVAEAKGEPSLQIVESAQINPGDQNQQEILRSATHFNPVDLVLSIKDYRGEKFPLRKFRNDDTGMVVEKTHSGHEIKALELPGLWNGAMHYWNTIFVEVPIETFNPVKTIFDLRRPNHR